MKQKIIAIGGGDFRKNLTLEIDKEIVRISEKNTPNFLFIPTASNDDINYSNAIQKHFTELGCKVDILSLVLQKPEYAAIEKKITSADIIYVGGGNTLKMMKLWRKIGVDKLLNQARERGAVLCGLSAGSICWFNYGNSDSRKFKNPDADYIKVKALGFVDAFNCPHYDTEPERKRSLKNMMQKNSGVAIAIEDSAALQIIGDKYRVISSNNFSKAYKVFWKSGKFFEQALEINGQFNSLSQLFKK